jgi:hypothetical protein
MFVVEVVVLSCVYFGLWLLCLSLSYQRTLTWILALGPISVPVIIFAIKHLLVTLLVLCAVFASIATVLALLRRREMGAWMNLPSDALALELPVVDGWTVAGGGPFAQPNHHTTVPAERFAYDLVKSTGESFGAPIVAPVHGVVEHIRDDLQDDDMVTRGRGANGVESRYGNFVSIRVERARVLLCHLRKGSVVVRVGDHVSPGHRLGDCGDSGRSFEPHLHIHAQDQPANRRGEAVPIAFIVDGEPKVPRPGDFLA